MDKYTARLRKQLVANKELAIEISNVLAKYELQVPEGMMLVWGPTVIDKAETALDIPRIWLEGIPAPDLLLSAFRVMDKFRL